MNFWETQAGFDLGEAILHRLNETPKQYSISVRKSQAADYVRAELKKGNTLYTTIDCGDKVVLVFTEGQ